MKGAKLLFVAFLCLFTNGARAQYVYNAIVQDNDNCKIDWGQSGNIPFTIDGKKDANEYSYNAVLIDKKRGLKYFLPDPSNNTIWSCYVGLDGDYKTSTSPVDSVAIPSTITYTIMAGTPEQEYTVTRHVTVIVNTGFTTTANGVIPDNDTTDGNGYVIYKTNSDPNKVRNLFKNQYLEKVTFIPASDGTYSMQSIGDRAFQGCVHLKSAMIPPTVTRMGESVFGMCFRLKNFEFITETKTVDGSVQETTQLEKLPDNTFYMCMSLQSLDIPYGVKEIGDYTLQDNYALKQINLPNSLTKIGAHFLCRAYTLKQFYIPSSVTDIDGAFLHGCEGLSDVYLLGKAADLKPYSSTDDETDTFSEWQATDGISRNCRAVQNCTFHVTNEAHEGYISSSSTWYVVYGGLNGTYGNNGGADTYKSTDNGIQHNRIIWPGNTDQTWTRDFDAYKWVSVIFYNSIPMSTFKSTFGSKALAATYTDCYKDNASSKVYHLGFTTISSTGTVPAKTPLMIYIGETPVKGYQMNTDNTETTEWKEFYTHRYNVEQNVRIGSRTSTTYASGESVNMVGLPVPIPMHENEFYFKWISNGDTDYTNPDTHYGRIRRCVNAGDSYKGRFSCFWQIKKNGALVQDAQLSSAKGMIPMEGDLNSPTGINEVKTEKPTNFDVNIYDINGRLVGTSRTSLPKGLYIQGGKKFIKK